ncbi:SDR family oxidoreductase [Roseiconus lacunae]|uniref:NAD-dependent epimerase/dehydratase family protein n=1 Tax=Roseiconus lacunae TaxID=2605694 RepID=UPI00308C7998|nr:SDR family oxidoreductase [Stieleria sp. HD01]
MAPKTILVTGASGFLGSTIGRILRPSCDRLIYLSGSNDSPADHVVDRRYHFRMPDARLGMILSKERPTWVIHCAGSASVRASIEDPKRDFHNNVTVTEALYEAVAKHSPGTHLVNLSSAAVYGQPERLPITLRTPARPVSPYGKHKRQCELITDHYAERHGIHTVNLRIFSSFGPGLRKQVLWDIFQKAKRSREVMLFGDGTETRDFIFSHDIARLIGKLINTPNDDIVRQPRYLNVASGTSVQIKTIAQLFLKQFSDRHTLRFSGEQSSGDPKHWSVDVPTEGDYVLDQMTQLEDGLAIYARWIRTITESTDADRILAAAG